MHHKSIEDHNFIHLTWDIVWFGIAWVTVTRFLSVYAIRVGATPTELGWLTAGPPLGMLIASVISVWWRARFPDSIRAILLPSLLFRFSFLLLALTPLFPTAYQPLWLIIAVTLPSLPQGISNIMFMGLLKETTPQSRMTLLFGRRTLAVNIALGAGALGFGLMLEQIPYPWNYVAMFGFAFLAAMLSQWHLTNLRPLPEEATPAPPPTTQHQVQPWREPRFRTLTIVSVVSHIAFFAVAPVMALRLVEGLGAGEGFMAIFSVVELAAAAGVAVFITRIVSRVGNRAMVGAAMLVTVAGALVAGTASTLTGALLAAAFTGGGWSTAEIGLVGYFTETIPTKDAARYTRAYSQAVWLAIFCAPFIGSTLAELGVPLGSTLVLGALLRLGAGLFVLDLVPVRRRVRWVAR
jgi:MFS family permease